ncbi:hypothetical protein ACE939_04180 [Aquimarina sp. W85]|uniref:hypothetical protein n=1 Tax=Aquimarina rhodophyticola TaxID=3342246 RepID=UPI0036732C2B
MGYKIIFNDNSEFSLFDSSYYNDKAIFNIQHQSNLISFSVEIVNKGIPKKVIDESKVKIEFNNDESFYSWFKRNQATEFDFGFANLNNEKLIKSECQKRNDLIIDNLRKEIDVLKPEVKFNPWRINGGYKKIEKLSLVTIKSIEKLENKKVKYLKSTKSIFETVNESGLIDYSKKHDSIDQKKLLDLCQTTLKKIEKLNKKKWWKI